MVCVSTHRVVEVGRVEEVVEDGRLLVVAVDVVEERVAEGRGPRARAAQRRAAPALLLRAALRAALAQVHLRHHTTRYLNIVTFNTK